jgi:hypothetical protein
LQPRFILDKNFLQGGQAGTIARLCEEGSVVMPDVLFYEMISCEEPARSRCFRKLPQVENPIVVVPNTGKLLRLELQHQRPCGVPSTHALDLRFRFNPKLAQGGYVFPKSARKVLEEATAGTNDDLRRFVEMVNLAPLMFPDVFKKGLSDKARLAAKEDALRQIADDTHVAREGFRQLSGPAGRRLAGCELGPDWIHFRWLQVMLAAVVDLGLRYGRLEPPFLPKREHEVGNFVLDMQYAMLALLEGGLASNDAWLRKLYLRLGRGAPLIPTAPSR